MNKNRPEVYPYNYTISLSELFNDIMTFRPKGLSALSLELIDPQRVYQIRKEYNPCVKTFSEGTK